VLAAIELFLRNESVHFIEINQHKEVETENEMQSSLFPAKIMAFAIALLAIIIAILAATEGLVAGTEWVISASLF
jgi:hypothetical protein